MENGRLVCQVHLKESKGQEFVLVGRERRGVKVGVCMLAWRVLWVVDVRDD